MDGNRSTDTARIRTLTTSMVALLDSAREVENAVGQVKRGTALLVEAYQWVLNEGSKQLALETFEDFDGTLEVVEEAYKGWRSIDDAFLETHALAYSGEIPRHNLTLDGIHAELRHRIGDPIGSLYARLHATWREHLERSPWDSFLAPATQNVDSDRLESDLKLLVQGDHLDVEDAIVELSGPLRHTFAHYLENQAESLDLLEEALWMRPEIVVMNDYWQQSSGTRILDILTRRGTPKFSGSFARVQSFFEIPAGASSSAGPEKIAEAVKKIRSDEKNAYLRCLMMHPDQGVRRYAVNNVDLDGFWNVVTPQSVPCATILNMLEKVAGSENYDENFQKVFFDASHKRLLTLTSKSDVLYARGIVRIFALLPFFMEDEYFERLMLLVDYLSIKEREFRITDGLLDTYLAQLRREKDKIGTLKAQTTNLTTIPPVVLRKLARDGHYWYELAMHPMFKIARETIAHLNSPDRVLRIANNHAVNQDVLREIGKRRSLFAAHNARMALLSNPKTPPGIALDYAVDLTKGDLEQLLRRGSVHPELRHFLRSRLGT